MESDITYRYTFKCSDSSPNSSTNSDISAGIDTDFAQMAELGFTTVRTFYSTYHGHDVAPIAAKYGLQLYLGVFMTTEDWYQKQVNSAVLAVQNYPDTIKSILVGNENIKREDPFNASFIASQINSIRLRIKNETGRVVPVGTVQRTPDWLQDDPSILAMADASDVIGVNIYPFYDVSFDPFQPQASLNGVWNAMAEKFGGDQKLLITETGWPTGGTPTFIAPNNIPSFNNAHLYYNAFMSWMQTHGRQGDVWYSMYDPRPEEKFEFDVEYHFGILTHDRQVKTKTTTPQPTPAPTPTPKPSEANTYSKPNC
ncbi:hypothetical protein AaE_008398 [Aphanomyces astaci]|uniref:glucan endo-1,3-beta-D-glucosidase n=1 Tax=Aphanomyces astaci TaxID=112090 RepID=A0A6A5AFH2_APHAT|nr:hypothetical protein AaE_008398 [Aphanomyces astaci]